MAATEDQEPGTEGFQHVRTGVQVGESLNKADTALQPDAVQTVTNKTFGNYAEALNAESVSTSLTIDLADGMVQALTLTANTTLTLPADPGAVGKSFRLHVNCAGFVLDYAASPAIAWDGGSAPTLTTTSGAINVLVFDWLDGYNSGAGAWFGMLSGVAEAP